MPGVVLCRLSVARGMLWGSLSLMLRSGRIMTPLVGICRNGQQQTKHDHQGT